ncbi:AraC family transcriptional regulator [Aestuariirhabdus litorea]|nr:AraC family transcriptional regulator [Aestuariirhabdus litorea]
MFRDPTAHHIRAIRPALEAMQRLGFSLRQCLAGSGLDPALLDSPAAQLSLAGQQAFYRHLLAISAMPLLGLELGRAYRLEHYGMFGYALLSARNLGECVELAGRFSPLAFSLFRIQFVQEGNLARIQFHPHHPIADDLLAFYCDRDLMAVWEGSRQALGIDLPLERVGFMHDQRAHQAAYRQQFNCPLQFRLGWSELCFDSALLDTPLPCPDPETSVYFREQCQRMIAQLSRQSPFVDRVRQQLMQQPGQFPDIDAVALQLNTSVRTLRRRLADEQTSFRRLLDEIRFQLARDYLGEGLRVAEVAALLGYSETANFTHAFKRWSGQAPSQFQP